MKPSNEKYSICRKTDPKRLQFLITQTYAATPSKYHSLSTVLILVAVIFTFIFVLPSNKTTKMFSLNKMLSARWCNYTFNFIQNLCSLQSSDLIRKTLIKKTFFFSLIRNFAMFGKIFFFMNGRPSVKLEKLSNKKLEKS